MLYLRSPLLSDVRHGFSTRQGGVSSGRYATLNLGGKWGDAPACVEENRRRLAAAGGFALERLRCAQQVHGAAVVTVDAAGTAQGVAGEQADALVTRVPGVALGVYTADCVPIVLADGRGRVGVAHAGWRGTVAGVAAATVAALVTLGARRDELRAALGPSICVRCFEVGEEVAVVFERVAPTAVHRGSGRPHVDLWEANRAMLLEAGLSPTRIDGSPPCTHCDEDRFFSFRRDGAGIGQHLSFVVASEV